MLILPFLGIVVTAFYCSCCSARHVDVSDSYLFVVYLLQLLLSAIAVIIDDEDWKLVLYSPLMVVGYKQIIDLFVMKGIFDVLFSKNLKWTSARRAGIVYKTAV